MVPTSLQTLERGLDLLMFCAESNDGGCSLQQVIDELGVARSSAYRLIKVLRDRGFLRATGRRGHLELGYQLVHLGRVAESRSDLSSAAYPVLCKLVRETGETSFITVRSGWRALCLEQAESPHPIRLSYAKGVSQPLYAGASGKIVLAHLSEREQEKVLSGHLQVFTDELLVQPDVIRRDLKAIRENGYALSRGEIDPGAAAMCVPLFTAAGHFLGGLNIAGPANRVPANLEPRLLRLMRNAAREISERFESQLQ